MPSRRVLVLLAASALFCPFFLAFPAYGQDDSQSLADAARQARLQKQQKEAQAKDAAAPSKDALNKDGQSNDGPGNDGQAKDAQAKDAPPLKPHHVITNEELPSHPGRTWTTASAPQTSGEPEAQTGPSNASANAEQWKSQIQAQKSTIASLESQIASLNDSIHYVGGNCVSNCVQWNEHQKEKQDQVETMKGQLEQEQKRLEDLQESARKQGFGSSVYEP
ncbi:MAG: hypothetical protein ABSG72_15300 [Candidatus Sulfotelmatobacter sp.]|jgi:hypothetical protein